MQQALLSFVNTVLSLLVLDGILRLAARADAEGSSSVRFNWLLGALIAFNILTGVFLVQAELATPDAFSGGLPVGIIGFGMAILISVVCIAIMTVPAVRLGIQRLVGGSGFYNPNSHIHTAAVVLCLLMISIIALQFIQNGGSTGLASDLTMDEGTLISLLLLQVQWVGAALIGVGLLTRRAPAEVWVRLGLKPLRPRDVAAAVGVAVIAFLALRLVLTLYIAYTSPELLEEQNQVNQALLGIIASLPAALLISIAVAIGEELIFRGALQPVFGNVLTSLIFAGIHTQYYTIPVALIAIFGVSLSFGWLRSRYSTSAAMVAHFVYNFIQLALALLVLQWLGGAT